ncbi:hypothetical protein Saro_0052 [Novosphingobium aromaticivorans DSM 12444]|uniref:Uncharacterized protein n=1 Tax=Novosphingobium aromaticivorans (strain ATCC 700278 / DSM 12444 / CCUG 56034 / CIP 105152 / NBRC 16084 / F199) TaxID=279238 RepID=Q2GCC2_NOVAD|nr:hypothetical protein [Novosphingobium aromaticivorans]ABD24501.1 hypothetical protein Saro_0052 [Novosphingobium aromaticivorans DSM 12444]
MMKRLIPAALIAASTFAGAAHAQDQGLVDPGGERVNQLIVYGNDPCPVSEGNTITVCARKDEEERFRIPKALRDDPNAVVNQAWSQRVKAYETVGAFGTNSCSAVGAGGATGCLGKLIDKAYAEKKNSPDVQFGKLIEEERAKRLQTIDADAAAEQGRVEQIEKEYEARLKREREEAAAQADAQPSTTPPLRP